MLTSLNIILHLFLFIAIAIVMNTFYDHINFIVFPYQKYPAFLLFV